MVHLCWRSADFRSLISKVFFHPTLLSPTDLLAVFWRSITNLNHLTLHSTAYNKARRLVLKKNCFSAWASTLNMGLINKVDMVCLSPVGYGV